MATTLKDTTIAASYADLMKRQATYSATGSRVEIMDDAGVGKDTALYLDITNQRLGIGTDAPASLLDIRTTSAPGATLDIGTIDESIGSGNIIGAIGFVGNDPSANNVGARIRCTTTQAWASGATGCKLGFWTTPDDSTIPTNEAMVIMDDGNVGIGTAVPGTQLDIKGQSVAHSTNAYSNLNILDTRAYGATPKSGITFQGYTTGTTAFTMGGIYMAKVNATENNESSLMRLLTRKEGDDPLTRMTIDEDGNVGIGTTVPTATLHVKGSAVDASLVLIESTGTTADNEAPELVLYRNADLTDAGDIGCIRFRGLDDTGSACDYSLIEAEIVDESNTEEDGLLRIKNVVAGSEVTACTFRDGQVGIGTGAPSAMLHIDQSSASGAKPVLKLDQADIDDTFIDFIGTSAADGSRSISTDTTTDSAKFGAIAIEINGVSKWIRIYDDHS